MIAWVLNTYRRYLQPWYEEEETAADRWYREYGAALRERDEARAEVKTLREALEEIRRRDYGLRNHDPSSDKTTVEIINDALAASPVRATPEAGEGGGE